VVEAFSGSVDLETETFTPWSRFPSDDAPDRVIPGVNSLLNGINQSDDFFMAGFGSLFLEGGTTAFDPGFLSYTMADAEAGDQADVPILPGGGGNGEPFLFQGVDVPDEGAWFDPPLVDTYAFETTDGLSNFVGVGLPPFSLIPDTDMSYIITSSEGVVAVSSSGFYTFGSPVSPN